LRGLRLWLVGLVTLHGSININPVRREDDSWINLLRDCTRNRRYRTRRKGLKGKSSVQARGAAVGFSARSTNVRVRRATELSLPCFVSAGYDCLVAAGAFFAFVGVAF